MYNLPQTTQQLSRKRPFSSITFIFVVISVILAFATIFRYRKWTLEKPRQNDSPTANPQWEPKFYNTLNALLMARSHNSFWSLTTKMSHRKAAPSGHIANSQAKQPENPKWIMCVYLLIKYLHLLSSEILLIYLSCCSWFVAFIPNGWIKRESKFPYFFFRTSLPDDECDELDDWIWTKSCWLLLILFFVLLNWIANPLSIELGFL